MTIELIPIIEIGGNNQGVPIPDEYPYWNNSDVWDKFHQECFDKAGYTDLPNPYLAGSSFYKLSDITDRNLSKLVVDHTEIMRNDKTGTQRSCSFFGGYVLRVDRKDKYFPQCCGELSDIIYWDKLANGNVNAYYEGHPAPTVTTKNNLITFDFSVREFDEPFQPTPPQTILQVERTALQIAVAKTKKVLEEFGQRLNKINIDEKLNIEDIDKLLIWENENATANDE